MFSVIMRRLLWTLPTLLLISIITFTIIKLPPGDYLTSYITALQQTGDTVSEEQVTALRARYDLDKPVYQQYMHWMFGRITRDKAGKAHWQGGLVHGDMGMSFEWNKPVNALIGERLLLTLTISIISLLLTWAIALPIGIYSAVRQYSWGDYAFTALAFVGMATPSFLLALVLQYVAMAAFGQSVGGLFSPEYASAPWSWGRVHDLFNHLWIPALIIGVGSTAGMIRIMRGNLLDELRKQYVLTAEAKGLQRWKLIIRYPVRVALNPMISTIGWTLPALVSGETLVAVVLSLPTVGPLLLQSLMNQDMYLAGSMVMMLSALTVIGTLISDLLLLWLDPRIKFENVGE